MTFQLLPERANHTQAQADRRGQAGESADLDRHGHLATAAAAIRRWRRGRRARPPWPDRCPATTGLHCRCAGGCGRSGEARRGAARREAPPARCAFAVSAVPRDPQELNGEPRTETDDETASGRRRERRGQLLEDEEDRRRRRVACRCAAPTASQRAACSRSPRQPATASTSALPPGCRATASSAATTPLSAEVVDQRGKRCREHCGEPARQDHAIPIVGEVDNPRR